jgi:hypothetical protein
MEMRNSPPKPPLQAWDNSALVEELCLVLREIGVENRSLPDGEIVRAAILRVKEISAEIEKRNLDCSARLARLSRETAWDMVSLLRDSLAYPDAVPYLASTPNPTCGNCGVAISRKAILALCDKCVRAGLAQLSAGESDSHLDSCPICGRREKGFLVYAHGLEWMNYCRGCLEEASARYRQA